MYAFYAFAIFIDLYTIFSLEDSFKYLVFTEIIVSFIKVGFDYMALRLSYISNPIM